MKEKSSIHKVYKHNKTCNMPSLLRFQNGRLSAITKENTVFCQANQINKNQKSKAAIMFSKDVVYTGSYEDNEQLTDNYICIRNKITNKVSFIPIEKATLNNRVYNELKKTQLVEMAEGSSKQKLLKQFGGRKAARYFNNQEDNNLDIDKIKTELDIKAMEATLIENNEDPNDLKLHHFNRIRPKFNPEAKNIDEIYDVSDVVANDLLNRLESEAQALLNTPIEQIPIKSEYLLDKIKVIQNDTPSAEGLLHIKLIIYMDCLLNALQLRKRTLNGELSKVTEKVETVVRNCFSDNGAQKFVRTPYTMEKIICYFIVLSLLISENYKIDINILSKELRTARKNILKYAAVVNAYPKSKTNILELRLPSTMPNLPIKTGRKTQQKK